MSIESWLKVLKQDKKTIFHAASHAERAANHLHSYQKRKVQEQYPETEALQEQPTALAEESLNLQGQPQLEVLTELAKEPIKEAYVQGSLF